MSLSRFLSKPATFHPVAIAAFNQVASAADRILNRWPDVVTEPPERDRERLVQEVLRRLQSGDWSDTRMSLVTTAAVALFDVDRRDRSDLTPLRQFYCDEIQSSDRRTFLNTMVAVFVGSYVPGAPHTRALASALTAAKARIGARWSALLERIPEFLDPSAAPAGIARRMVGMASPWDELRQLGLRSPHAPGLMDHAHLSFVDQLAPQLHERGSMERLFLWLKPEGQQARASGSAEAISALLTPWLNRAPSADDERYLTERLISLYGDPRIRSENVAWGGVPAHLRAIFDRWLTGENIRFFLDVVSAVEESHMWAPRRQFWLGLHNQKRIDAAWVAFSREGVDYARRKGADNKFLRFGRQEAGGSRVNTSLLILKVGNKIVVEGSHSYKVHVFRDDHPKAPKLYEGRYDCEHIRLLPGSWSVSHNGDWQSRVLEHI
ncbi:EH signature domain-containing protein [Devosia sp. A449]